MKQFKAGKIPVFLIDKAQYMNRDTLKLIHYHLNFELATRLTWLLVRIAFDAGQTRSLVTNILGRQKGVHDTILKTILESSSRSAKANIMRRTPQIASLISSVEQSMTEDSRGVSDKKPNDRL